jgi:hypothetical protein
MSNTQQTNVGGSKIVSMPTFHYTRSASSQPVTNVLNALDQAAPQATILALNQQQQNELLTQIEGWCLRFRAYQAQESGSRQGSGV